VPQNLKIIIYSYDGNIGNLVTEGHTIQSHLPHCSTSTSDVQLARSFANLMFEGKTSATIKLITGYKHEDLLVE